MQLDFVPSLRTDVARRVVDGETIVWSPSAPVPTVVDPVAAVLLDVVDGDASIDDLSREVHEEIGVPLDLARQRVMEIVESYDEACLLTTSTSSTSAETAIAEREAFVSPCSSCMERAARNIELLTLLFGARTIGVACGNRRIVRKLRSALGEHVVEDDPDVPIGFMVDAPAGFQRDYRVSDRSGLVHSEGRGLDAALRAVGGHLTAFLPVADGHTRMRATVLAREDRLVLCVFPLPFFPPITDQELIDIGYQRIDRLVLDVEIETGRIDNPPMPWHGLAGLAPGHGHRGSDASGRLTAVVAASRPDLRPVGRAEVVASLAGTALAGTPTDILDATTRLVDGVPIIESPPAQAPLLAALQGVP